MGGGQELFDKNQQISNTSKELNKVHFLIFPISGSEMLFDEQKLYNNLRIRISDFLRKNNILYESPEEEFGGGGGGAETLLEILKNLWATKDVIMFVISFFGLLLSAYHKHLNNDVGKLKPRAYISFWIETNANVNKIHGDNLQYIVSRRLANLLLIVDNVFSLLCEEYQYLFFDFSIKANIKSINYSIEFAVNHEERKVNNYSRLLKIIRDFRVKKNFSSMYKFTKFFAILRTDNKLIYSGDSAQLKFVGNYYLMFSSRIVRDYFN